MLPVRTFAARNPHLPQANFIDSRLGECGHLRLLGQHHWYLFLNNDIIFCYADILKYMSDCKRMI